MSQINCERQREAIVALVMGDLGSSEAADLRRHLDDCSQCRAFYEDLLQEEHLVQGAFAGLSSRVDALQRISDERTTADDAAMEVIAAADRFQPAKRRWSARSLSKWAVAAVLIAGVIGLFSRYSFEEVSLGATFGEVMQQIQKARSVQYMKSAQIEGQSPLVGYEMAMDPGHVRTVWQNGRVAISDFAHGVYLDVSPSSKVAQLTRFVQHDTECLTGYLDWLQKLHAADARSLGERDLNGQKVNVFQVNHPFEQITVWADQATMLPVQVEWTISPSPNKDIKIPTLVLEFRDFLKAGQLPEPGAVVQDMDRKDEVRLWAPGVCSSQRTITLTNFVWNATLDGSLFDIVPPADYRLRELDFGDPPANEQALVESLRLWAETSDGSFPDNIDALLNAKPKLVLKCSTGEPVDQEYANAVKMAYVVVKGLLYAQTLKALDNWNYNGSGLMLGDADKPLCWWKSDDNLSCRVIYGDLTVRSVPIDQMPQAANLAN